MKKNPMHLLFILFGFMAFMTNTANAQIISACDGPDDLNNIAEVSAAAETDLDSTPDNRGDNPGEDDTAQNCTTINPLIDLSLEKIVSRNFTLDGICTENNGSTNPRDIPANCLGAGEANPTAISNIYCDDQIEYTLTLSNAGPSQATGVEVQDILPVQLVYDSSDPDGVFVEDTSPTPSTGGTVTWTGLTVNVGSPVSLKIVADVTCS